MRRLNRRIEVDGIPCHGSPRPADALGLTRAGPAESAGTRTHQGRMFSYLWSQRGTILSLTLRHLLLVGVSLAAAIAVALPLGLALERGRGPPSRLSAAWACCRRCRASRCSRS